MHDTPGALELTICSLTSPVLSSAFRWVRVRVAPCGHEEPETQDYPSTENGKEGNHMDFVYPVKSNEPHGKCPDHEVDENHERGGGSGAMVHLFENQVVAGGGDCNQRRRIQGPWVEPGSRDRKREQSA